MGLTSGIVAAFCLCMLAPPPSFSSRADSLAVSVNLEFDQSITSKAIRAIAKEEAAAIWRAYGVDLVWTGRKGTGALSLDAIVDRYDRHGDISGLPLVLGRTIIASNAGAQAPIHISFDAITVLVEHRSISNPWRQERESATGLGRVLAHEIGHVLLGAPAYHDPDGLMRTTFVADDFVWGQRSRFQLTERSAARLRARIASFSNGELR
jgi:hypothetical protein